LTELYHGRDVPFASEDLDALHALWTDPDVRRYLWDDIVISRERAAETGLRTFRTRIWSVLTRL
jgi:hypothetical protein